MFRVQRSLDDSSPQTSYQQTLQILMGFEVDSEGWVDAAMVLHALTVEERDLEEEVVVLGGALTAGPSF